MSSLGFDTWVWSDGTQVFHGTQEDYNAWLNSTNKKQRKPAIELAPKNCECGSEVAGSSRHSTWCPKFEK